MPPPSAAQAHTAGTPNTRTSTAMPRSASLRSATLRNRTSASPVSPATAASTAQSRRGTRAARATASSCSACTASVCGYGAFKSTFCAVGPCGDGAGDGARGERQRVYREAARLRAWHAAECSDDAELSDDEIALHRAIVVQGRHLDDDLRVPVVCRRESVEERRSAAWAPDSRVAISVVSLMEVSFAPLHA